MNVLDGRQQLVFEGRMPLVIQVLECHSREGYHCSVVDQGNLLFSCSGTSQ